MNTLNSNEAFFMTVERQYPEILKEITETINDAIVSGNYDVCFDEYSLVKGIVSTELSIHQDHTENAPLDVVVDYLRRKGFQALLHYGTIAELPSPNESRNFLCICWQ